MKHNNNHRVLEVRSYNVGVLFLYDSRSFPRIKYLAERCTGTLSGEVAFNSLTNYREACGLRSVVQVRAILRFVRADSVLLQERVDCVVK